jgi:hypothetical protein
VPQSSTMGNLIAGKSVDKTTLSASEYRLVNCQFSHCPILGNIHILEKYLDIKK